MNRKITTEKTNAPRFILVVRRGASDAFSVNPLVSAFSEWGIII